MKKMKHLCLLSMINCHNYFHESSDQRQPCIYEFVSSGNYVFVVAQPQKEKHLSRFRWALLSNHLYVRIIQYQYFLSFSKGKNLNHCRCSFLIDSPLSLFLLASIALRLCINFFSQIKEKWRVVAQNIWKDGYLFLADQRAKELIGNQYKVEYTWLFLLINRSFIDFELTQCSIVPPSWRASLLFS